MLITIIKNNKIIGWVFTLIILAIVWAPSLGNSTPIPMNNAMPLYELYLTIVNKAPFLHPIVALVLIISQAAILNLILNTFELMVEKTIFPGIIYCLLMSSSKPLLQFYPLLFANFFILLALLRIAQSYRVDVAFSHIFDASFFISIASLFYFPAVVIYPLVWVTLIVIRPFVWREWIISFIGLISPYLFVFTYYFWMNKINFLLYDKIFYPSTDSLFLMEYQQLSFIVVNAVILLLTVISLIQITKGWPVNTIFARNYLVVILWLLVLSVLSYLMAPAYNIKYLVIAAIPLAIFIANFFISSKRKIIADLLFACFTGAVIYEMLG
ncbi:MAG: hypothetical protein IT238_02140 [Bacteroidia bacterium]|nr:hypothetical protein [Bacteroidia bacterium]MCZ2249398.1 hypothetical protein [Bacteroidia bacterium]